MKLIKAMFGKQERDPAAQEIDQIRKELMTAKVSMGRELDEMIDQIHLKWSKIDQHMEIKNESLVAL